MSTLSAAAFFMRRTARLLELRAYECLFEGASHDGFVGVLPNVVDRPVYASSSSSAFASLRSFVSKPSVNQA